MVIAVTGDFVAVGDNGFDRVGEAFGNRAAGHESRLHLFLIEDSEYPPNRGVRAVLALGVLLMVPGAVWKRTHILTALEIERQRYRDPRAVRPAEAAAVMIV